MFYTRRLQLRGWGKLLQVYVSFSANIYTQIPTMYTSGSKFSMIGKTIVDMENSICLILYDYKYCHKILKAYSC